MSKKRSMEEPVKMYFPDDDEQPGTSEMLRKELMMSKDLMEKELIAAEVLMCIGENSLKNKEAEYKKRKIENVDLTEEDDELVPRPSTPPRPVFDVVEYPLSGMNPSLGENLSPKGDDILSGYHGYVATGFHNYALPPPPELIENAPPMTTQQMVLVVSQGLSQDMTPISIVDFYNAIPVPPRTPPKGMQKEPKVKQMDEIFVEKSFQPRLEKSGFRLRNAAAQLDDINRSASVTAVNMKDTLCFKIQMLAASQAETNVTDETKMDPLAVLSEKLQALYWSEVVCVDKLKHVRRKLVNLMDHKPRVLKTVELSWEHLMPGLQEMTRQLKKGARKPRRAPGATRRKPRKQTIKKTQGPANGRVSKPPAPRRKPNPGGRRGRPPKNKPVELD